ncbi:MAG TPA: amidohydrolase family protein [Chloroflexia bacterium]|nr:amidohydrolase family protein [Chloroflexia bacterium]
MKNTPPLTLLNARLIDGTGAPPRNVAAITVENGRITAIHDTEANDTQIRNPKSEIQNLEGRTLLPGLINAHMHITMDAGPDPIATTARDGMARVVIKGASEAKRMLHAGITTARDLGGFEFVEMALRDAFASGEMPGPRLLCAGKCITMTGGHGWQIGIEADGPDEVRKAARLNLRHGADCIKIMATGGVLTPGVEPGSSQLGEEEMRAGIEEAHKVGKLTATHAQGTEGIKAALRAGIDTVEHGIFLDEEAIEMMLKRGTIFVPTLAAPYQIVEAGEERGIPAYALEKSRRVMAAHRKSFEWALSAGVTIAAGNDGGTPFNPSHDLVTELRLMVEYGMNPISAIRAATHGSARALGLSEETGTIQPGKWADCLVLQEGADPLQDITALSQVWMVIKQGEVVSSA